MSFLLILGFILSLAPGLAEAVVPGSNTLVSYNASNTGPASGIGNSAAHISEDGKVVSWLSSSRNVISGDPYSGMNGGGLWVRNLDTGVTVSANQDMNGAPAAIRSQNQEFAMSRTGRYVVFTSDNRNMVASPTVPASPNQEGHIYLRDIQLGITKLVDQSETGVLANTDPYGSSGEAVGVSDDGRFVVFSSYATNLLTTGNPSSNTKNYYVKDMATGKVINPAVSDLGVRANASVAWVSSSCDGSLITFASSSTTLTPQDDGKSNVYIVDIRNGQSITNLTYAANAASVPRSISCNGRYIVIGTTATNLTSDAITGGKSHWYRYDRLNGEYVLVDKSSSGYISSTEHTQGAEKKGRYVSDNGLVVFRTSDKNMISPAAIYSGEAYLRNPEANTTELIAKNSSGSEQNAIPKIDALEINARGDAIVYDSIATNLIPDITTGEKKIIRSLVE